VAEAIVAEAAPLALRSSVPKLAAQQQLAPPKPVPQLELWALRRASVLEDVPQRPAQREPRPALELARPALPEPPLLGEPSEWVPPLWRAQPEPQVVRKPSRWPAPMQLERSQPVDAPRPGGWQVSRELAACGWRSAHRRDGKSETDRSWF